MDTLRTEPKRCTKKSCKTIILPPAPNERDYSTCESCRAQDAASKKKRKRNSIPKELCLNQVGPMVQDREGGASATSRGSEDSEAAIEDKLSGVSTNPIIYLLHLPDAPDTIPCEVC